MINLKRSTTTLKFYQIKFKIVKFFPKILLKYFRMAKIVIVDDDPSVRKILHKLLFSQGHEVITTSDPLNAFSIIKNILPNFIILDRHLPFTDGDNLLLKIKKYFPTIKVIIFTGYDDESEKENLILNGADLFISKSENISSVIEKINSFVNSNFQKKEEQKTDSLKILVVDDEIQVRKIICKFIKECGYEANEAENGTKALEIIEKQDYDAIFLDIFMPEIDGEKLLEILSVIKPQVKVVVISGNETEEIASKMLLKGAFDYIKKPINFNQLKTIIKALLILKGI